MADRIFLVPLSMHNVLYNSMHYLGGIHRTHLLAPVWLHHRLQTDHRHHLHMAEYCLQQQKHTRNVLTLVHSARTGRTDSNQEAGTHLLRARLWQCFRKDQHLRMFVDKLVSAKLQPKAHACTCLSSLIIKILCTELPSDLYV